MDHEMLEGDLGVYVEASSPRFVETFWDRDYL